MDLDLTDRPLLLGIEIGGTKLQVGLGRRDETLLDLERVSVGPARTAEEVRAKILDATARLIGRAGIASTDLAAIGIGFGGPVDADRGVVLLSNQVPGWADFPLAEWTRSTFGVRRVALENDAATAALGEARSGAGLGFDPVLYLTIGSGIGGGLIVGGSIYRGSGRGAIEIGHLLVEDLGPASAAGDPRPPQTLEQVASGWSIAREGQRLIADADGMGSGPLWRLCQGEAVRVTAPMVATAAVEGDPGALPILARAWTALGQALAHAVTLLAPRRVILGGGVSLIGDDHWFAPIRAEVDRRVFPPFRGSYDIVPAALGEAVVVHGALALALDARRLDEDAF